MSSGSRGVSPLGQGGDVPGAQLEQPGVQEFRVRALTVDRRRDSPTHRQRHIAHRTVIVGADVRHIDQVDALLVRERHAVVHHRICDVVARQICPRTVRQQFHRGPLVCSQTNDRCRGLGHGPILLPAAAVRLWDALRRLRSRCSSRRTSRAATSLSGSRWLRAYARMRSNASSTGTPFVNDTTPLACSMTTRVFSASCSCSRQHLRLAQRALMQDADGGDIRERPRGDRDRSSESVPDSERSRLSVPIVCSRSRSGIASADANP